MSQAEQNPAPPSPQVVYVAKSSRVTQLMLFVLVLAVLTVIGIQVWPSLNLKFGSAQTLSRDELINQLSPEEMTTPAGRRLELVEMGGKVFEITRILHDAVDARRGMVSITVPGKPPQQGIYRVGDSFDRGRIAVKEIGDGYVVLKCDGEQRAFGVQGAMPDEAPVKADVTVTPGTHMIPPRDLGSDIPAPTGRVKSPENPVQPKDPKDAPKDSQAPANEPGELEPIVVEQVIARDEWRDFIAALPQYLGAPSELRTRELILQTNRDPESLKPLGLEIVSIDSYARFSVFGFRRGDVITRLGETQVRGPGDVDAALKQAFRNCVEIELWRNDELYVYRFVPGESRLPKKTDK